MSESETKLNWRRGYKLLSYELAPLSYIKSSGGDEYKKFELYRGEDVCKTIGKRLYKTQRNNG